MPVLHARFERGSLSIRISMRKVIVGIVEIVVYVTEIDTSNPSSRVEELV